MKAPCKDCALRFPGCKSLCARWAEYQIEKAKADKARRLDAEIENYDNTQNRYGIQKRRR